MKILWEPFSFLSILFVRLNNSTRPTTHCRHYHQRRRRHYVNAFTVFTLLFAQQCFTHDLTTDKLDDNHVNVTTTATAAAAQAKWLNDNRSYGIPAALDAKVLIFKRQSPTKLSNSSSSSASRMSTRINYGTTTMASVQPLSSTSRSDNHHHHQHQNRPTSTSRGEHSRVASFSSPQPTPQRPLSLSSQPSHRSHMNLVTNTPVSHVLILIQTKKNIELNLVRDQFHQFTDMVGVKLENITIDFDVIDGKCELSLSLFYFFPSFRSFVLHITSFTLHNVSNLSFRLCACFVLRENVISLRLSKECCEKKKIERETEQILMYILIHTPCHSELIFQ